MLAVGHAQLGHRVSAVAIVHEGNPEPPIVARLTNGGVRVTVVKTSGRSYRAERENVRAVLESQARGISHSHGYRADVLHSPAAGRLGFSTVTTLHGFTGGDIKNRIYEHLQRRACRRYDRVVAVSQPIAERMLKVGVHADRLRTVRNAFVPARALQSRADARDRLGLPHDGWIVGFVGRLSSEKGPDVLLDALSLLRDLPITAAFVGEGREEAALRARSIELGVERMVRWIPVVDEAGSLFAAFDAFALSSRTEGTPIALFEAMNAGVPIVATSVGGVPDVVSPAEAVMVPPDAPALFAAGVRIVFTEPEQASTRAGLAVAKLESDFAPGPWLRRYETIYAEALVFRSEHG